MKKVCVVTAARSEYGVLRWTIDSLDNDSELELQLVVTGAHLSVEHGETWRDIVGDGYLISAKVDMALISDTREAIVESMGHCSIGFAQVFKKLQPDILVVLGDRYELLPICSAALVMNIPIAHISGGDVTEGAIDNEVRNAITMMSTLHFPGVEESAYNIMRMVGRKDNVYTVGEPGLENFKKLTLWSRDRLASDLSIPMANRWILVTVHPETQQSLSYNCDMAKNIIESIIDVDDITIVITQANADFGGMQINEYFQKVAQQQPNKVKLYSSLGQIRYLSFMRECYAVIGNSSSGIIEAPCLGKPVINIGNRQKGRHLCANVRQVDNDINSIKEAWHTIENRISYPSDYYYGDGNTSSRILKTIKGYLYDK